MTCATELQESQPVYAEKYANCHRPNQLRNDPVRRSLPLAVQPHLNNPFAITLRSAIRNATYTLLEQADPLLIPDHKIPSKVLKEAHGFLFLTFARLGFLGGARFGSGLAVVKREDGTWSAPSAVGMGGLSIGFMAGVDCVNVCLVMNNSRVCDILASKGQLTFNGELGASVGPIGRTGTIGVSVGNYMKAAPIYAYCQSRGLFAGIDLNGSLIVSRKTANHKFYGRRYETSEILGASVPQPEAAKPLYEAIMKATSAIESHNVQKLPQGVQQQSEDTHLVEEPLVEPPNRVEEAEPPSDTQQIM
jgi:lipid-binding SYLF domain-containing protein